MSPCWGLAWIGQIHTRTMMAGDGCRLVAVADANPDAAKAVAQATGARATTVDETLNDSTIAAVLIATSTDTHSDLIERAVTQGKAVLCEKSVDLSLDRALWTLAAADAAGQPVMIDFVAHAAVMGAHAVKAARIADLEAQSATARGRDILTVIVIDTDAADGPGFGTAVNDRPQMDGDQMAAFAAYLASEGIVLDYQNHMGAIVESSEEIDALMTATGPAVHLLFDAGPGAFGGGDPAEVLEPDVGRVAHLHAKNIRRTVTDQLRAEGMSFLQGVLTGPVTVPGDPEGEIDFTPLRRVLADAGCDRWLAIEAEQDPVLRNPLEYQAMGLAALKGSARAAGLDRG